MTTSRNILFLIGFVAVSASADDAGLKRCRAISEAAARLACYDALPLGKAAPMAVRPAAPATTSATPAPSPSPQVAPAPTAAASPSLYQKQSPEQFGMERKQVDVELAEIQSVITGRFEGFRPNKRLELANGQVWQVADDTRRLYDVQNPKVTIQRGALGAFYLSLDGDNLTVRVRRVQ